MQSIQKLALDKVRIKKVERAGIAPGEYSGEVLIRLIYDLNVGEDYEQSVNVPWQKLACVAMSKLNEATQDAIIREALDKGVLSTVKTVEPRVKAKVRSLMPDRECKGKVTGDTHVELAEVLTYNHRESKLG
jgi:hypothetical protein